MIEDEINLRIRLQRNISLSILGIIIIICITGILMVVSVNSDKAKLEQTESSVNKEIKENFELNE